MVNIKSHINDGYSGSEPKVPATVGQAKAEDRNGGSIGKQKNPRLIALLVAVGFAVVVIIAVVAWYLTKPVDGGFSNWSSSGPCSKTCGGGTQQRTRKCDNPEPKRGGKKCNGPAIDVQLCANNLCPGSAGIAQAQQLVQDILLTFQMKQSNGTQVSGRFQKAVFAMQREVANEQAFEYVNQVSSRRRRDTSATSPTDIYAKRRSLGERLEDMKKVIKIAANRTSKDFARSVFAKSLYVFIKKTINEGTPISKISKAANGYLEWIKKDIGKQRFDELMLATGGATLMFAIDTTGSMRAEINAAKEIAVAIVNKRRQFPVDYVLSPFNDPATGPVTYMSEQDRDNFVAALRRLRAHGGGDCPELAFTGMLDALRQEPQLGSPMFVFTDASAKDSTRAMINEVKKYAEYFSVTINFFMKNSCGVGIPTGFDEVASHTSGQIFPLQTDTEIQGFKEYVEDSLKDSVVIHEGKDGSDIFITLDGEINLLVISLEVKQANQAKQVKLVDPVGRVLPPILTTVYSCIFRQQNPFPGTWHLKYPATIDIRSYVAKSAGNNTIDFKPYFLHTESDGEDNSRPVLSVSHPVIGKNTTAMLQIAGSKLLAYESLSLDILREDGKMLQENVNILKTGGGEGILKGSIDTPVGKFKMRLKGRLLNGQNFTRLSQLTFQASNIVMVTIRAGLDYTATVRNRTVPIKVYFFSNADRALYRIRTTATKGSAMATLTSFQLAKGANTTISVIHTLSNSTSSGEMVKLTVVATNAGTAESKEHQIQMMYVP